MKEHSKLLMPVTNILRAIRDAQVVRNAERQLLDALALRCNPAKGYSCCPSYEQLRLDTGCSLGTLRQAAAALERKNLIGRHARPNQTNRFVLNMDLIVELAEAQRAKTAR